MPQVVAEPAAARAVCRAWTAAGQTIGLVPTMGNLHAGHRSLIDLAVHQTDHAVVSIFVNPKQFGPREDFAAYPRTFEADLELCQQAGVELVFAPTPQTMYPPDFATRVEVDSLTEGLDGASRPGHFAGVTTVVARLHGLVLPTRAYYGEKDYQQLRVISRMNEDLGFGTRIVAGPTVREADGLALSSRNQYLSAAERQAALCLWHGLQAAVANAASGPQPAARIEDAALAVIADEPLARVDYCQLVDPYSLVPMAYLDEPGRLCVAAFVGTTRLIDNVAVMPGATLGDG